MKSLFVALSLGLALLVGCAAPDAGEDEANTPAAAKDEAVATQTDELISTGGGTSTGWSAGCMNCKDDCDREYPGGGGPLQTCKKLCVLKGACKSTTGSDLYIMR